MCIREEVEKFCDEIKEEYCYYLYKNADFPYCCQLSADLVTNYLRTYYGNCYYRYLCTTNPDMYNHAWTDYRDEYESFAVDFTEIQHHLPSKFRHGMDEKTFKEVMRSEKVVYNSDEIYVYETLNLEPGNCLYSMPKELECISALYCSLVELNKECFMEYVIEMLDVVKRNTKRY